jgi:hypothetical protein
MAARKTTPKPPPADEPTPEVEPSEEAPTPEVEPEGPQDDEAADEPTPEVEDAPPGYMWVQRRKSVQLGGKNPQWGDPQLIDVKSFAELEPQGWRSAK